MEVFNFLNDDDDDILEFIEHERRPYIVRERYDAFNELDDTEFFIRFRMRKTTVLFILRQIEEEIETPTDRNHSISPINQLLLALRFYATGSFLITVGDFINVSKSSACNIVRKVSHAIASLSPRFIKMPENENDILRRHEFNEKARLPRILGSIDCTHVRIQSPGGEQAELFRNRKGFFSINVQTVASVNLKIMDIVARWPGSTHDQMIFDNSNIKRRLENGHFGNSLLVADSGYANTMHVITPLLRPQNETEHLFNEAVTRTRNPVERQYGVWKRRFPVLAFGLRLKLENVFAVIVATAVLHNIALNNGEDEPPLDPNIDMDNINFNEDFEMDVPVYLNLGNARDILLNDYLPRLIQERR